MTAETVAVDFIVTGIQAVPGAGRLVGLANVELEISGVVLTLQGVTLKRDNAGAILVTAPQFRDPAGVWRSAVILPDSLRNALGDAVQAAWQSMMAA